MEYLQEDLLTEEISLVQAESGKRLANYLIDVACFYATLFILVIILGIIFPVIFVYLDELAESSLKDRLISLTLYAIFMAIVEGSFKGRTLGKVITGTRAVNEDGSPISFGTGFLRGFIRAIPFCAFSALGSPCYPWQDKWTNTYVIDIKKSTLPA